MIPLPDDYTVRLVDMPVCDEGMISEDPDGHINVYINARLSSTGQHTAAYHEWEHWYNDDLHSDKSIEDVEGRSRPQKPQIMRARDLLVQKKKPATVPLVSRDGWKDDVYLRMQDYRDM